MGYDDEMCNCVVEIMSDPVLYQQMSQNVLETILSYTMSNMAKVQMEVIGKIVPDALNKEE